MDWKFWKKNSPLKDPGKSTLEKLSKPKDIPVQVGMHLVAKMGKSPDWVWSLRVVERIRAADKNIIEYRVFDPAQAGVAKIGIKDFYSLSQHPELILFEGSIDKKLRTLKIEEKATVVADTKAA